MDLQDLEVNFFILFENKIHLILEKNENSCIIIDEDQHNITITEENVNKVQLRSPIFLHNTNFMARVLPGNLNGRANAYVNSILDIHSFILHLKDPNDEEETNEVYFNLMANREDIDHIQLRSSSIEIIIKTKNSKKIMEIGDNVKLIKKNKFTKSKSLSIGDEFIIKDITSEKAMVYNKKGKLLYIDLKLLKCHIV